VISHWDEEQQRLKVEVSDIAAMGPGFLFTPEGLIGQTWARQQPAWVRRLDDLEPEEIRIADQQGPGRCWPFLSAAPSACGAFC
jgi:hypothetical protein